MIYSVKHVTTVRYAAPVARALFNLRLIPWAWTGQSMLRYNLSILPPPDERADDFGPYCVNTTRISFTKPLIQFEFLSEFEMEIAGPSFPVTGPSLHAVATEALAVREVSALSPAPYLFASRIAGTDENVRRWAAAHLPRDEEITMAAGRLMAALHDEFAYKPGSTSSVTSPSDAFLAREGVCQDFAHVMIVALRSHGIPAAYASGYLRTNPPPGAPRLVGADAMHAWVNVWCGRELGWIGFDPTNNCRTRLDHIQIAMGRDYADVAPIDGTFIGSAPQLMKAGVDVVEIV